MWTDRPAARLTNSCLYSRFVSTKNSTHRNRYFSALPDENGWEAGDDKSEPPQPHPVRVIRIDRRICHQISVDLENGRNQTIFSCQYLLFKLSIFKFFFMVKVELYTWWNVVASAIIFDQTMTRRSWLMQLQFMHYYIWNRLQFGVNPIMSKGVWTNVLDLNLEALSYN